MNKIPLCHKCGNSLWAAIKDDKHGGQEFKGCKLDSGINNDNVQKKCPILPKERKLVLTEAEFASLKVAVGEMGSVEFNNLKHTAKSNEFLHPLLKLADFQCLHSIWGKLQAVENS